MTDTTKYLLIGGAGVVTLGVTAALLFGGNREKKEARADRIRLKTAQRQAKSLCRGYRPRRVRLQCEARELQRLTTS